MSDNYINCFTKDSRGFVWIGTWHGINRFDGFTFKKYVSDKTNPKGMQGDWVLKLYEDRHQNFWACTNTELMKYNWELDRFEKIKGLDTMAIHDVLEDYQNHLWVTTEVGLFEYDLKTQSIINIFALSSKKSNFPSNKLTNLVLDHRGNLYIGSLTTGLIYFNTKTYQFRIFEIQTPAVKTSNFYNIRSLAFDSKGKLWMIGKFNCGLAIFDTSTFTFTLKHHDAQNPYSISSDAVSHIASDREGNIWVSTQNESLCRYDEGTDRFYRFENDYFIPTSLHAQSASCVYQDDIGNYWIGSHGNGIFWLNKQKNVFKTFSMKSKQGLTLPSNIISSFAEWRDGTVIVGTDGGGISFFDRKKETFKTLQTQHGLLSNAVTKVITLPNDDIWIASWNGGLNKFDASSKKMEQFKCIPQNLFSLIHNNLKDVYPKNDSTLWVVTHGHGISTLDLKSKKFISQYSQVPTPFDFGNPLWGNSIMKDRKGRWWISTTAFLSMYDGKKLISYNTSSINQQKRSSNFVYMTYEDHKGVIWIVTDKAVDVFDEKEQNYATFTALEGMPKNPKAILEDLRHNLWISSSEGLVCLDSSRNSLTKYSLADGLPSNDFVGRSAFRLKDGTLLFGGTFGFVMFHPDSLYMHANPPQIVLNEVMVNHAIQQPGPDHPFLHKPLQSTDTITYPYNHDVITLHFAGLDLSNPELLSYAYQLEGLNDDWIPLDNERSVTIPNLEPGTYTLRIQVFKPGKFQKSQERILTIIVTPLWWQTVWLKLGILGVLGFFIYLLVAVELQKARMERKRLETLVKEKTRSLVQTIANLNEANETIEVKNKELQESIALKNKLIGIIAHDIKSPMNALSGLVELVHVQTQTITRDKLKKYMDGILASAHKLEHNLGMMVDWAHSHFKNLHYNPSNTDVLAIAHAVVGLLRENARQKNIRLDVQSDIRHTAYVDARMIHSVCLNLLSNALKFTPTNGSILITLQETEHSIELAFVDTGIGMSKETIEKLFENPEFAITTLGTNAERGFGFGLQICRQFVQTNQGTLTVKSTEGKGSVFILQLPKASTLVSSIPVPVEEEWKGESSSEVISSSTKFSILLIDDDEELLLLLSSVFESNYHVFKASDGKSGLQIAQNLIPDIIVTDIRLPEMTGLEVCYALKKDELTSHIPVILISGEKIPNLEEESYAMGAMGYFAKPFQGQILKSKVKAVLDQMKPQQRDNHHSESSPSTNPRLPQSADDVLLKKIMDLMYQNIENAECDVDSLASELGLSRTQFWRKTKTMLDKTPNILLRDLRLEKAIEMIKSGKYRVSDIAYHVGFSDPSYFTRIFTKVYGQSPTEYFESHKLEA